MAKKKDRKKAAKKKAIKAKVKAKKKAKQKVRGKAKVKKEKAKNKKNRAKGKKAKILDVITKDMTEESTSVTESASTKPIENSSISVNAHTAISMIRSLKTVESVNNYVEGDVRITVKKAATSKITTLLKELY